MEDPWSNTNKINGKQCGQYNPIEKSIGNEEDDGRLNGLLASTRAVIVAVTGVVD